jgi:RNA polymerase sigma-70 factor (ECF subfamily)
MQKAEKLRNSILPNKAGTDSSNALDVHLGKAKLGDSEAFAEIYDQYASKIYSFASRMVRSREDAEDITQDTFFLAYRNLKHLREDLHFEQWLYKIARNEIYKKQRKAKFKHSSLDDSDKGVFQLLRSSDPAGNPENKLLSVELAKRVKAVFDTLPMKYRETLILATLQGLSYLEVSQVLGRSLSSVKTDVYRARLLISEKMRRYSNL